MAFSILEDSFYPDAAQSWEQVDAETLVFNLREGVRYNPEAAGGREVTAEDWAINLARYPDSRANRGSNVNELFFSFMDRGPGRVLRHAGPPHPAASTRTSPSPRTCAPFAAASLVVVAPERLEAEESGDLGARCRASTRGSGPYMFDKVTRQTRLTLKRNPNYYDASGDAAGYALQRGHTPTSTTMEAVINTDGAAAAGALHRGRCRLLRQHRQAQGRATGKDLPNVNIQTGPGHRRRLPYMIQLAAAKWTPYPELSPGALHGHGLGRLHRRGARRRGPAQRPREPLRLPQVRPLAGGDPRLPGLRPRGRARALGGQQRPGDLPRAGHHRSRLGSADTQLRASSSAQSFENDRSA